MAIVCREFNKAHVTIKLGLTENPSNYSTIFNSIHNLFTGLLSRSLSKIDGIFNLGATVLLSLKQN